MTTAQYRLPGGWQKRFGALEADLGGTFTVTVGSADETAILAAGALLITGGTTGDTDIVSPAIKGLTGTALVAGDTLRGGVSSSGTPGSGTSVLGYVQIDAAGKLATVI